MITSTTAALVDLVEIIIQILEINLPTTITNHHHHPQDYFLYVHVTASVGWLGQMITQ